MKPFAAGLKRRIVVFDPPYFSLDDASEVQGLVSWGAHDPGVARSARPKSLLAEMESRFGPYPAAQWIYGFVWPSADRTREIGEALVRAVGNRADMAEWLFAERLPDWDLGFMVVSEYHSGVEALWHGVDPSHPLHELPSAEPARRALEGIYEAGDRLLGRLMDRLPDARFALFNLHGMGANNADVAAMALLPELLYRHAFGKPCMSEGPWPVTTIGAPIITSAGTWEDEIDRVLPRAMRRPGMIRRGLAALLGRRAAEPGAISLDWMPAARYAKFWPLMQAFALPSFYDGQIRINLKGREARGTVDRDAYDAACGEIEILLADCRDAITGKPVVASIERTSRPDRLGGTEADLVVLWEGAPLGLVHPRLGRIGPLPYRRPGGHTGNTGFAYLAGPGIRRGDYGVRSAFDIVPTMIDLLGGAPVRPTSGESFRHELRPDPSPVDA
jgi:predicted AlkP superfamily phosphohydrolase/phosphomutase